MMPIPTSSPATANGPSADASAKRQMVIFIRSLRFDTAISQDVDYRNIVILLRLLRLQARSHIVPTSDSRQITPMVTTLGEALDAGWRLHIRCAWGRREGLKSVRECKGRLDADLRTLVWTRGRDYPIARLESRLKCPACGSRRVLVAFIPPSESSRASLSA